MKKKLIIGVDVRDLKIAKTGTKTYLEELCRAFKLLENDDMVFHLLTTKKNVYTGKNKYLKLTEHIKFIFWKQIQLPIKAKKSNCTVVLCSDFFVPWIKLNYQTVAVFHDAFFWEYPKHYNKVWLKLFYTLGVSAAKRSAYIITPSEYAKKQILKFLKVIPQKVQVIYEAPKSLIQYKLIDKPKSSDQIKTKKYILHVGTFEKRKNLVRLVQAFSTLRKRGYIDYSLVLIGQASPKEFMDDSAKIQQIIKKENIKSYVISPGYVNDKELAWYYKHGEFYVFPSINEGFGLPVLEAFAQQLPVMVANNTCLPEIGKSAVLTFDPFNLQDMIQKIQLMMDSPELRKKLISKGNQVSLDYSWNRTANEFISLFKSL